MDFNTGEFEFSKNYFLAKELGGPGKNSVHKLSKIDVADEQELRAAFSDLEPKHEKEFRSFDEKL